MINISQMLKKPEFVSPLTRAVTGQALKNAALQGETEAVNLAEKKTELTEKQKSLAQGAEVERILREHLAKGGQYEDPELFQRIAAVSPSAATQLQKENQQYAKAQQDIATSQAQAAAATQNAASATQNAATNAARETRESAIPATVETPSGRFQLNPTTGKYDIEVGGAKKVIDKEIDTFTSADGYRVTTYQRPDGTTYEVKGQTKVQAPAASNTFNLNNPAGDAMTVKYIADQVRDNPLNWNLTGGNKTLQNQVRDELAKGEDVNRLTAATRQLGETADSVVPKIDATIKKLDNPKFVANLGPVMGRWNEFLTGKVGTNDPDLANLRATLSLIQTGTMRAHVGARGSEGLLDKFEGLVDGKKMDAATLKGSLTGIRDFLQGYRDRIHKEKTEETPAAGAKRGKFNPATGKVEY